MRTALASLLHPPGHSGWVRDRLMAPISQVKLTRNMDLLAKSLLIHDLHGVISSRSWNFLGCLAFKCGTIQPLLSACPSPIEGTF